MPISNVLNVNESTTVLTYHLGFSPTTGTTGSFVCICDKLYTNAWRFVDLWADIIKKNGTSDSLVYVMTATKGGAQKTYVGKTLNKLSGRYPAPAGPVGGLKIVTDMFQGGGDSLACTLYNVSHPALVEGWCYQILMDKGFNLANLQDPS
jgi:hypothetical protein